MHDLATLASMRRQAGSRTAQTPRGIAIADFKEFGNVLLRFVA